MKTSIFEIQSKGPEILLLELEEHIGFWSKSIQLQVEFHLHSTDHRIYTNVFIEL
jgi:hypothetical protein